MSTAHRLLVTLVAAGYVEQDGQTGLYRIGTKLIGIASHVLMNVDVRESCLPELRRLHDRTSEDAFLVGYEGGDAIDLVQVTRNHRASLRRPPRRRAPAGLTAAGKVLLAFHPEWAERYLAAPQIPRRTSKSITSARDLKRQLSLIAVRGFSIDDEEFEVGHRCVAAPVRDSFDHVVAALSLSGPAHHFTLPKAANDIAAVVIAAADRTSARLGRTAARG